VAVNERLAYQIYRRTKTEGTDGPEAGIDYFFLLNELLSIRLITNQF